MTPQQLYFIVAFGVYVFGFFYSGYVLWVLYLAVMNLLRVHNAGKLGKFAYYTAMPLLAVALIVDVFFNVVFGTIGFLQWPHYKRLTLSARMDDLILNGTGWRQRNAIWFVKNLLEPFDTSGMHTTYGK